MLRVTKNTNIIKPSMYKRVDEEKKRMRKREEESLGSLNITR